MKRWMIAAALLLAGTVFSDESVEARAELDQARSALDAGRLSEARRHAAAVQAFYYQQPDALAEALYIEVLLDQREGGPKEDVSALAELKTFFPDSEWCRKALESVNKDAGE